MRCFLEATLNLGDLKGLPMSISSIEEQKAIAHILGTLDDKIELNRKTNETLKAQGLGQPAAHRPKQARMAKD